MIYSLPDYIVIVDALSFGIGGVVVGKHKACKPMVFCLEWPDDVRQNVISFTNPTRAITNSDLETVGHLLSWLVAECVCNLMPASHVAIYRDNKPSNIQVHKQYACGDVAVLIISKLSLQLKITKTSPLIPLYIAGERSLIADIPSLCFGSNPSIHCKSDNKFLTMFNLMFPLSDILATLSDNLEHLMRVVFELGGGDFYSG